jgi:hypothetical protein
VVTAQSHPVLAEITGPWPEFGSDFGGYYDLQLREGATQILQVDPGLTDRETPFVAAGEAGAGRVMTFGALWGFSTGRDFMEWDQAGRFFANAIQWLSSDRATPDPGRDMTGVALDPATFPLDDGEVYLVDGEWGVGCQVAELPGGGGVAFATGTEEIVAFGATTDGRVLVRTGTDTRGVEDDLMAVNGFTSLRLNEAGEVISADAPVSIMLQGAADGPVRGVIEAEDATRVRLHNPQGAPVRVNGDPVTTEAVGDRTSQFSLPAGRHVISIGE